MIKEQIREIITRVTFTDEISAPLNNYGKSVIENCTRQVIQAIKDAGYMKLPDENILSEILTEIDVIHFEDHFEKAAALRNRIISTIG